MPAWIFQKWSWTFQKVMMKMHAGMNLDDEDNDHDGHANVFTLETQSKAGAHRVKLRPERIPSLRLPRAPTAAKGVHTQLQEAR